MLQHSFWQFSQIYKFLIFVLYKRKFLVWPAAAGAQTKALDHSNIQRPSDQISCKE